MLALAAVLVAAVAPQPARADDRSAIEQGRSAGRGAGAMFDRDRAIESLKTAGDAFVKYAPRERVQRFSLAALATQLAYDAAVVRSSEHSTAMLRLLAISAPLDAAVPGWSAARGGATSIGASDWLAQRAYALRLVDLIQKANPA